MRSLQTNGKKHDGVKKKRLCLIQAKGETQEKGNPTAGEVVISPEGTSTEDTGDLRESKILKKRHAELRRGGQDGRLILSQKS